MGTPKDQSGPVGGQTARGAKSATWIVEAALGWHRAGRGAALATVVETWGSAPRQAGAQLAVSGAGEIEGSVSGGCVEGAVVAEALDAIDDGACRLLEYGVSDEEAFAVGLACGGTIRVLVEPVGRGSGPGADHLQSFCDQLGARRGVVSAIRLGRWERALIGPGIPGTWTGALGDAAREGLVSGRSSVLEIGGERWFLGAYTPPLRLAVIGGVHIAQALAPMADLAGYDVTIIDPREAFATAARFPGQTLVHEWPDAALAAHGLDSRTAVVLLTHDPKLDDPALAAALPSDAFYIGALGSTRTHAKRVARLTDAGIPPERIARIDAPVGLDIGATTPAEIAVAVLAELTERLRRPETRPGERVGASAGGQTA